MSEKIQNLPEGFNSVSAYLVVPNAEEALAFYAKAFGAEIGMRMPGPGGKGTMHAEMRIGNSTVMLTDENPQWGAQSALTLKGSPVSLWVYVKDSDAAFNHAVEYGCEVVYPLMDAFWGDRHGKVKDPFGIDWGFATKKENPTPAEIKEGAAAWMKQAEGNL